eukprot:CAMPEP_0172919734 /NCGR_PEP_ID=MMETSP1075-20121228/202706_1 /TAXON_ID=2916 /ORGANISM="Ceratium fusus, Strain PA161109" /LENGTH=101 /DNA_ID=CAMNT_0013779633 /DNA_START=12 /DNA_END=314 /DNA_ORIENTATION=+
MLIMLSFWRDWMNTGPAGCMHTLSRCFLGSGSKRWIHVAQEVSLRELQIHVETYGALEDPVFCVRNVDGASGAKLRDAALAAVEAAGLTLPKPEGRKRRRR